MGPVDRRRRSPPLHHCSWEHQGGAPRRSTLWLLLSIHQVLTPWPMDRSPPGSSVHSISQARVLVVVAVQSLGRGQFFATPWTAACQASLFFTVSWRLLKLVSAESVMPSNHLILCHLLLLCLQSFPASGSFPVSPSRSGSFFFLSFFFLLQGIFPTQGSNLSLPHWQADSLPPSHHA